MEPPAEYASHAIEQRWQDLWQAKKVYTFDPHSAKPIYSVDTPPPTVSGKMHLGHSFSYSQQDFLVRYRRMRGFNIFYPFGTDDNGLATERLIEKEKGVKATRMERSAFTALCLDTLDKELRPKYVADWKAIGMSCDFSLAYTTINPHAQRISQWSFIDLYKKGREYRKEAPTIWCPECATAIAQVEMEDKELESTFNDIVFKVEGADVIIATTRPELLPACVAVFYHPNDARYQKFAGKRAKVPLFDYDVPILADERVAMDKGTGIVMCCTFGDQTDVEWYKANNLPLREAFTKDGKMTAIGGQYAGLKIKEARAAIIADMKERGLLLSQKRIKHAVNVHERCSTEIEIMNSKQWFIRYLDLKETFLEQGKAVKWYPEHMFNRYQNWVLGLQWDWCISRQRFSGVPFPIWYCSACDEVVLADEKQLPVDPLKDKPPVAACPKCGNAGFVPEKDVMDTWATSSLTPQISTWLVADEQLRKRLFPMDLRPQAHDIISFWLFNTIVKSYLHFGSIPWKTVTISGWALDPHGRKFSKSKGNGIEPQEMIKKYSADCLRYWASTSKLGDDVPTQEKDFVTGKKLVTKLWNATKFSLIHLKDFDGKPPKELQLVDKWLLSKMHHAIDTCTKHFEGMEFSKARAEAETFFYRVLCDQYLEIIKNRVYNLDPSNADARRSAQYCLGQGLLTSIKLFAPIIPHVTDEVYSYHWQDIEGAQSVHVSPWPVFDPKCIDAEAERIGDMLVEINNAVRKFKSSNNFSMKEPIAKVILETDADSFALIQKADADLMAVNSIGAIESGKGETETESKLKLSIVK